MTRSCAQCDLPLPANASTTQRYHDNRCRWDHSNGRTPSVSRHRQKYGTAWPVVSYATPVQVTIPPHQADTPTNELPCTALILPDTQFGYWRTYDGALVAMHDERALDIAVQLANYLRPDLSVHLGDLLDLPQFGRWQQEPGFAQDTQASLDRAHAWLASIATLSGETWVLEGNHDARLMSSVVTNLKAALGVKQAAPADAAWPVFSVPHLLRFEELGIRYVDGYPANARYINDHLAVIHGTKTTSASRTAAQQVVEDERVSVIFGHTHHAEQTFRTRNGRDRPHITTAYSPGCLCRIDGAVPGVKSGLRRQHGSPARSWQNWQQGIGVVRYERDGDQRFVIQHVPIIEGSAYFDGQFFNSGVGL